MLTFENFCNLERLTVCHIDVQKSKVESFMQNLLGDFNGPFSHDGRHHVPDNYHFQVHVDQRFILDNKDVQFVVGHRTDGALLQ